MFESITDPLLAALRNLIPQLEIPTISKKQTLMSLFGLLKNHGYIVLSAEELVIRGHLSCTDNFDTKIERCVRISSHVEMFERLGFSNTEAIAKVGAVVKKCLRLGILEITIVSGTENAPATLWKNMGTSIRMAIDMVHSDAE